MSWFELEDDAPGHGLRDEVGEGCGFLPPLAEVELSLMLDVIGDSVPLILLCRFDRFILSRHELHYMQQGFKLVFDNMSMICQDLRRVNR